MEICWKTFPTSNVEVNKSGEIRRLDGLKYLPHINSDGYPCVTIIVDGKRKTYKVHRLVAILFIENTQNKREVNHIDGNKLNNNISNLEWCTHSENIKHAWDNGLLKSTPERSAKIKLKCARFGNDNHKSKNVIGKTHDGQTTITYGSLRQAAKALKTDSAQVSKSANNVLTKSGIKPWAGKLNNQPLYWDFI